MSWNESWKIDILKADWKAGVDAKTIGGKVGKTGPAVIGKARRLKLGEHPNAYKGKRGGGAQMQKKKKADKSQRFAKPQQNGNAAFRKLIEANTEPYIPPAEELVIPLKERRYIHTLTESSCRWPIGDPQHVDFYFCGKVKIPGLPYCAVHARRAFLPPEAYPRKRRPETVLYIKAA
jgi:GcrA cell cycle regulator